MGKSNTIVSTYKMYRHLQQHCSLPSIYYSINIRYSITCIQRPLKRSNESGLLQQVVFKCRFYQVDLKRVVVPEQWSLEAVGLLIQV